MGPSEVLSSALKPGGEASVPAPGDEACDEGIGRVLAQPQARATIEETVSKLLSTFTVMISNTLSDVFRQSQGYFSRI